MKIATIQESIEGKLKTLQKLESILLNLEYSIHTSINTLNPKKSQAAAQNFERIYKDKFCPLFKAKFKNIFLYKLDYETNKDIFIYCLKICRNQSQILKSESFYYDSKIYTDSQNLALKFNQTIKDYV